MPFILIYATHPNKDTAQKIAEHLLNKKLIACVNYFPMQSSYRRKEKIENANEIITLLKTKKENWEIVKEEILKLHPYETPCIIKLTGEANESYEQRIQNETK
jgi:periplasmic divalent cation tolerance protein